MRVSVLGPLEVDGGATPLGPRDRVALAVLVLRRGTPVRADTIADILWGEELPASAAKVIQGCIVRLRKALGAGAIHTTEAGYVLRLHHDDVDVAVFEDLVARARRLLAGGQPDRVRFLADRALELWRGEPYSDLSDWPAALSETDRLFALRLEAEELDAEARLALGLHEEAVPDLARMVRAEPDREHRWALLALAQYRSGRQAEALSALQRARTHLVSSLGVDPGLELSALAGAVLRQDPSLDAVSHPVTEESTICPYPGLAPFEAADSETFFGRGDDVAACLRRLDENRVLALVGPSGCGKSSVLRAGVAASLLADGHPVEVLTPGPHPDALLAVRRTGPGVVLVVDQAEEVFSATAVEARAFLLALVDHVRRGGLLALGVRADRMGEFSGHPEAARLVEDGLILLGPLTEDGLRRAIEGPAAQAGLHVEPGLVELLVQDVLGEPGALPLLSHVLRRTWEHREGRTLTVAGYRTTGGVRGAVAQSAESLFSDLLPAEREALRTLMTRLVALDDHGDLVRQRVARESIGPDDTRQLVVGKLVGARLVSVDGDAVEISHESLAVAWPRLRSWLDEDVEGNRIMRHLSVAATSWAALGRPASELYRGVRQARAAEWADRVRPTLSPVEREFLDASTELAVREEQSVAAEARRERLRNRRLRAGLVLVGALLVASLLAGSVALSASREARDQALAADARLLGAEALRAQNVDTKLLLAASGVALHDDVDTRANLLVAMAETPAHVRTARVEQPLAVAVDPRTGHLMVADLADGLSVRDPDSLAPLARNTSLVGPSVVAGLTGGGAAATIMPDLVKYAVPALPPVVLLDETGAAAQTQLGGWPPNRYAQLDISFSPNGQWLAVNLLDLDGGESVMLGVWNLAEPEAPVVLFDLDDDANAPVVTDDGSTLLYLTEEGLNIVSLPDMRDRRVLTTTDLETLVLSARIAISPDGSTVAVGAAGEVILVDTETWQRRGHLPEVDGSDSLTFSRDGRRVALGTGAEVVAWDLTAEEPVEVLRQADVGWPVAISRDGDTLYSTQLFRSLLMAFDLTGQRGFLRTEPPPTQPVPRYPRISPDGTRVLHVDVHRNPVLMVRDIATGEVSERIEAEQGIAGYLDYTWSRDGAMVTMTTGVERISVWDSRTGAVVATTDLPDGEKASISFFTLDGASLLVGTTTGHLHVLDARTLEPRLEPLLIAPAGTSPELRAMQSLAPGPGSLVLTMLKEQSFIVDHAARSVEPFEIHAWGAGWSPDGERIFVTTRDGGVGLLDASTHEWTSELSAAQPFAGSTVVFSKDGMKVTTSAAGRVGVWDGRTGDFIGAVEVESPGSTAFTSDGSAVVIARDGGAVHTWSLDTRAWTEAACRVAGRQLTEQEWRSYLPDRAYVRACGP